MLLQDSLYLLHFPSSHFAYFTENEVFPRFSVNEKHLNSVLSVLHATKHSIIWKYLLRYLFRRFIRSLKWEYVHQQCTNHALNI